MPASHARLQRAEVRPYGTFPTGFFKGAGRAVNPSRNCASTQLGRPRLDLRRKRAVELGEVLLREVQVESPAVFPDVIERRRSRYDGYSRPADQPRERDLCRRRAMALGHAP